MKTLSITLAMLGLLAATALVAWFGAGEIWAAVRSVGWNGFALLCAWQFVMFAVLAASWAVIAPPRPRQPAYAGGPVRAPAWMGNYVVYLWGRMVRDSVGNCLPFTHMGGFIAGTRAVAMHGVTTTHATASTVADITAEVMSQAIFAAFGLTVMLLNAPDMPFAWPMAIGLAVMMPVLGAFVAAQQGVGKLFSRLSRRIAGQWFSNAQERARVLAAEFALIYGHPRRLAACVGIHFLGWVCTGVAGWITLRLLGVGISLVDAIAMEGLLHALMAMAFLVPGHAGVQEAAYIGLGAAFGVPPEMALAASLLRRARDLAWGVPVLLVWQGWELRRLRAQRGIRPSKG